MVRVFPLYSVVWQSELSSVNMHWMTFGCCGLAMVVEVCTLLWLYYYHHPDFQNAVLFRWVGHGSPDFGFADRVNNERGHSWMLPTPLFPMVLVFLPLLDPCVDAAQKLQG